MPDGSVNPSPGDPSSDAARGGAISNEQRLLALGEAVDQHPGVSRRRREPHSKKAHRGRRVALISVIVCVALIAGLIGGGYLYSRWRFDQIPRIVVPHLTYPAPGQPFNILAIGSDSRSGLSSQLAKQTGASSVSGQRSDVVKIIHVDPINRTVKIVSIPRDTVVTLLANQSLYGKYNRINVNIGNGPALLAKTITANFGIPINHVVEVSFGGLVNAAEAVGGVYLNFAHPVSDVESGLYVTNPGCQNINGSQALALTRSRHLLYSLSNAKWPANGVALYRAGDLSALAAEGWDYDGTSDYGRITRQNAFLEAMFTRVKGSLSNPIEMNHFLSNLPKGIAIDSTFTFDEIIGLAFKFHAMSSSAIQTYTLPTIPGNLGGADVLFIQQPAAQQLFVQVFAKELVAPTNPPPINSAGETPMPPVVAVTTTTLPPTSTVKGHTTTTTTPVTTTTVNPYPYNPVPCNP
jgi:LCP family protein required for cell wall assembly